MNCVKLALSPCVVLAASAMKKRRKGTERPSLSPASTLSA